MYTSYVLQDLPADSVKFWVGVRAYQANDGEPGPYSKLAEVVLGQLTMAHSTAAVERIFSQVTFVKNKFRNR